MRSVEGTSTPGIGAAASIAAAVFVVGVSYGVVASDAGLPPWLILTLSVTVLAGSAELLFVGAIFAGAAPLAAAFGGLLVNLRHGVYGMSAGRYLGSGARRLIGTHLVNDETVGFASTFHDGHDQRRAFWLLGVTIAVTWPLGSALGVLVSHHTVSAAALGLDAAFPAILIAMLTGMVNDRSTARYLLAGATVAVVLTPFVPSGLAPVIALTVLAVREQAHRG